MMQLIKSAAEMQQEADRIRTAQRKIGLVPTMGFLHAGHLKLIEEARTSCDVVIVSIYVNPTQFAPNEDFSRYPRDFERDKTMAQNSQVDILFCPENEEMYGDDFGTYVEEQEVSRILEGKFRPTHYRGVATVVAKLFNICKPHVAVFGQKDAQQVFIVSKMVRDLNFDVTIVVVPIVREPDGLAMSSRNVYLSSADRKNALVLHEALASLERRIRNGERDVRVLRSEAENMILGKGSPSIDYVAFVDPDEFREIDRIVKPSVLVALAARFSGTRLIDNALISLDEH